MARFFTMTPVVALVALALGCSGATQSRPAEPRKPIEKPQSELRQDERHQPSRPDLVAPPPAYGNKVVMAQGEGQRQTF